MNKVYKCVNGELIEMTTEEIAALEERVRLLTIAEKSRPLTADEVASMLITQHVNTLAVDDNTALRMKAFYPTWAPDTDYVKGFKVQHDDKLWRCNEAHTSQTGWEPAIVTASLWEQINETHSGTIDDPIPYSGNMALTADLYYSQNGVIYRCIRDTVNPVYNDLADLIGLYVEVT